MLVYYSSTDYCIKVREVDFVSKKKKNLNET